MLYNNDNICTVGLTGMSGAGKTTACEVFREHGFHIIDCDNVAREVVKCGRPALADIAAHFGSGILTPDGGLDRKKLGGIVFSDKQKLAELDGLIYPFIHFEIIRELTEFSGTGERLFLLDAPTLFESGADIFCDCIVSVTADISVCRERIMLRDGLTAGQAEKRLLSQHDAEFYRERSDHCAENNGDREQFAAGLAQIADNIRRKILPAR